MAFSPCRTYILYTLPDHFSLHGTKVDDSLCTNDSLTKRNSVHIAISQKSFQIYPYQMVPTSFFIALPRPQAFNHFKTQLIRENFPKKSNCSFGFCPNEGGGGPAKFFCPLFTNCICHSYFRKSGSLENN